MAEHALSRETYQVAFDPSVPPALEIDPGDVVTFETGSDAYERLAGGESVDAIGLPNFNRVTGPVAVRGAEPGDALAIEVLDVQVRKAFSVWLPGFGGLGGRTEEQRVMETPLEDGRALIGTDGVSVPIRPMIGCIGTAPAEGSASTFMPAYPHGGNMDLREMEPGTTLYLPVNVPGGLLSMGDLHAAMGTAEPSLSYVASSAPSTKPTEVSLNGGSTGSKVFYAAALSSSGVCYYIKDDVNGGTTYAKLSTPATTTATTGCTAAAASSQTFGSSW